MWSFRGSILSIEKLTIFKDAFSEYAAICTILNGITVQIAIFEFAYISSSICKGEGALSVHFNIFEFTNIFIARPF